MPVNQTALKKRNNAKRNSKRRNRSRGGAGESDLRSNLINMRDAILAYKKKHAPQTAEPGKNGPQHCSKDGLDRVLRFTLGITTGNPPREGKLNLLWGFRVDRNEKDPSIKDKIVDAKLHDSMGLASQASADFKDWKEGFFEYIGGEGNIKDEEKALINTLDEGFKVIDDAPEEDYENQYDTVDASDYYGGKKSRQSRRQSRSKKNQSC